MQYWQILLEKDGTCCSSLGHMPIDDPVKCQAVSRRIYSDLITLSYRIPFTLLVYVSHFSSFIGTNCFKLTAPHASIARGLTLNKTKSIEIFIAFNIIFHSIHASTRCTTSSIHFTVDLLGGLLAYASSLSEPRR